MFFDGNVAKARLMGLEYIISEELYNGLPTEEEAYWHPTTTRFCLVSYASPKDLLVQASLAVMNQARRNGQRNKFHAGRYALCSTMRGKSGRLQTEQRP